MSDVFKIFGIGLCKTGTKSLTQALTLLGIQTIHYPHDSTTYRELRTGAFRLSVMNYYRAATDLPIAYCYEQLDAVFPKSKFILTVRDKISWLRSAERHWRKKQHIFDEDNSGALSENKRFALFITACVFGCHQFHSSRFSIVYDRHCEQVLSYFASRPQDLLVLDLCGGAGWGPLCQFLGRDIPTIPFPRVRWKQD